MPLVIFFFPIQTRIVLCQCLQIKTLMSDFSSINCSILFKNGFVYFWLTFYKK